MQAFHPAEEVLISCSGSNHWARLRAHHNGHTGAGHHAISTTPPIASRQLHIRAPISVINAGWEDSHRTGEWHGRELFSFPPRKKTIMQSIEGYVDYTRREFCHDVACPIQSLLDK